MSKRKANLNAMKHGAFSKMILLPGRIPKSSTRSIARLKTIGILRDPANTTRSLALHKTCGESAELADIVTKNPDVWKG